MAIQQKKSPKHFEQKMQPHKPKVVGNEHNNPNPKDYKGSGKPKDSPFKGNIYMPKDYKGNYKGKNFNPNYKGKNFDPNYKGNYKGKNFDPNYKLKFQQANKNFKHKKSFNKKQSFFQDFPKWRRIVMDLNTVKKYESYFGRHTSLLLDKLKNNKQVFTPKKRISVSKILKKRAIWIKGVELRRNKRNKERNKVLRKAWIAYWKASLKSEEELEKEKEELQKKKELEIAKTWAWIRYIKKIITWRDWKLQNRVRIAIRKYLKIKLKLRELGIEEGPKLIPELKITISKSNYNLKRKVDLNCKSKKHTKKPKLNPKARLENKNRSLTAQLNILKNFHKIRILKGSLQFVKRIFYHNRIYWKTRKKFWTRYTNIKRYNLKRKFKFIYLKKLKVVETSDLLCKLKILRNRAVFYKKYSLVRYTLPKIRSDYYTKKYGVPQLPPRIDYTKKVIVKDIHFFFKLMGYYANNFFRRGLRKKSADMLFQLYTLAKFKYNLALDPLVFQAVHNVRPSLYFRAMYIGGKKYRIPILLNEMRGIKMSLRWILASSVYSTISKEKSIQIFNEFLESSKNESLAVKKRKEHHLAAYENKPYIRFLRFLK